MFVSVELSNLDSFTKKVATQLYPGVILLLYGDMGAGKTTFVSSLASHFNATSVCSPTFSLANRYVGDCVFNHLDLYRLSTRESLFSIDIDRYLNDKDAITCIEWPDKLGDLMPSSYLQFTLSYSSDTSRNIEILSVSTPVNLDAFKDS